MANTEIRNALSLVRSAKLAVVSALDGEPKPSKSERERLRTAWKELNDADDLLVEIDLATAVGKLEKQAKRLKKVNDDIQETIAHLKGVAKTIDKAAKGIDALVQAAKILIKFGLL